MGLGAGWVACGDPTIQQFVAQQSEGAQMYYRGGTGFQYIMAGVGIGRDLMM